MSARTERILVFNSHEGWISLLEGCGYELDLVVGLPGRAVRGWDQSQRPIPRGARLLPLERIADEKTPFAAVVCHNIADLLAAKPIQAPKLLVLHKTLKTSATEQGAEVDMHTLRQNLQRYLELTAAHVVSVTPWKASTFGFVEDVVPFGVDVERYLPWTGVEAAGIRVSNQVDARRQTLLMDLHDQAFAGLPVRLVGRNRGRPGAEPSRDHDHLKWLLSRHRFFVHTADPELEDGFNLASLEAMAAGLPVLGNAHPRSPIRHGVDGFLSDDPKELRRYAEQLINDRALAERMGIAAKERVQELFPLTAMHEQFRASVLWARALHLNFMRNRAEQVKDQRQAFVQKG